jgi:hypothetical protein
MADATAKLERDLVLPWFLNGRYLSSDSPDLPRLPAGVGEAP